jgi:hypothetical protein
MPTERVIHEYDTDDDAVVVERGGDRSLGTVLGILIVLVILAAVWWFALGPGLAGTGVDVNVNPPPADNQPAAS